MAIKRGGLTGSAIRAIGDAVAPSGKGRGRLCIVNYHRILSAPDPLLETEPNVETFRWQAQLMADCFNVLPLHEAVRALSEERMPPRAVAITFDDGYRSLHDYALPILKEFGLPATVFVTSGQIENGSMWNDVILEAVRRLPDGLLELDGVGSYPLFSNADRKNTALALIERSKYLPPAQRTALSNQLEAMVGHSLQDSLMLTGDMIRTLDRNHIEIGGHTITHPILTRIDDETARGEILGNKQQLEAILGKKLRMFAYPNGKYGVDFDERHIRMVEQAGYTAAFTTAAGAASSADGRYALPRSRPWDGNALMFAVRLLRWLSGMNP